MYGDAGQVEEERWAPSAAAERPRPSITCLEVGRVELALELEATATPSVEPFSPDLHRPCLLPQTPQRLDQGQLVAAFGQRYGARISSVQHPCQVDAHAARARRWASGEASVSGGATVPGSNDGALSRTWIVILPLRPVSTSISIGPCGPA